MPYIINIGKEQAWYVSQSTRRIFDIVREKLEFGKENSKFKHFHLLNNEGTIKYKKSTLDFILNDFEKVKQELNLVKKPVASLYVKDMEIGYAYGQEKDYEEWVSSKDKGIGINAKGMFVRTGSLEEEYVLGKPRKYKHFKELKKEDEYFDEFLSLGISHTANLYPTKQVINKVDRITHGFKSANIVHGETLEKLEEFVEKAKKEKKSISISY